MEINSVARHLSAVSVLVSAFLVMIGVGAIVALLPQRVLDLSGSLTSVGYLAAAYAVSNILLQIPIGRLADRFGFKPFLVAGYLMCAATGLLYYFTETAALIFAGRMLQGLGEVPVLALAPALLAIQFPLAKGRWIGLYNASLHGGLTAGSILGVVTHRVWADREAFLLFAGLSLLSGIIVAVWTRTPAKVPEQALIRFHWRDIAAVFRKPANRAVLSGIVLYGAGYGIFITLVPAFLILREAGRFSAGTIFTLFFVALSLAQLTAGPFGDRRGRKASLYGGLAAASAGFASIFFCQPPWLYGPLALGGFGLGVFCIAAMAYLHERVPDTLKGTLSGTIYFAWGAGYFLGPLVLAAAAGRIGLPSGFLILAGCFMLQALVLLKRVDPKPPAQALRQKIQDPIVPAQSRSVPAAREPM